MEQAIADKALRRGRSWNSTPSFREVMLLAVAGGLLFVATILHFRGYQEMVRAFGDSGSYVSLATAISHWNFQGLHIKQFWGYPYVMAAVSKTAHTSEQSSLLFVCSLCSFVSIALAFRLWGGWIAGSFAVINFDWLQRSYLGGAEPLFVALLFAAFWAVRRERWTLACCLASCATITRPLGFFALLAFGLVLLIRKEYYKLLLSTAVSLLVGALYLLPFWIYWGDPFYEVHRYQSADWHSESPISWPLLVVARSFVHSQQPWTNVILTFGWFALVLLGTIAMARKTFRQNIQEHTPEFIFAFLYIGFLFSYNSSEWARAEFVRFAIPILPFILLSLSPWFPKDRRVLWGLGVLSPILAAASAIGIRNVMHALG